MTTLDLILVGVTILVIAFAILRTKQTRQLFREAMRRIA